MRILLVEDDQMIGASLVELLSQERYIVQWERDADSADIAAEVSSFDFIVLDLGLPDRDGLTVLRRLRNRRDRTPVLIVTARDALEQRIQGLDMGADDYIIKPFDFAELLARVRALQRRVSGISDDAFEYGEMYVNLTGRVAKYKGIHVQLSAKEWALLDVLLRRPSVVFSRKQLEDRLYGWTAEVTSNAVEVHIHSIRKKLGQGAIRNIRGIGYTAPKES
ncbi:response regulator transcription factor [Rhodoferax mekongensis]|uniref:response regulator transcription factor n=1 Tax=Rhodoferax mekongensis TaxID=3068341 RepID=UPI0028BDAE47|nr:response regulator transcription factor [Rhodoferax sp. TBRC 17199]MDT7517043.1 response regulator transcription factor [Rhodoferax sp. TBRC 17199]